MKALNQYTRSPPINDSSTVRFRLDLQDENHECEDESLVRIGERVSD